VAGLRGDYVQWIWVTVEEGGKLMLGIKDVWILGAYLLSIASTLACVVYGIVNWNKDGQDTIS
jgi:hypothetical protein